MLHPKGGNVSQHFSCQENRLGQKVPEGAWISKYSESWRKYYELNSRHENIKQFRITFCRLTVKQKCDLRFYVLKGRGNLEQRHKQSCQVPAGGYRGVGHTLCQEERGLLYLGQPLLVGKSLNESF